VQAVVVGMAVEFPRQVDDVRPVLGEFARRQRRRVLQVGLAQHVAVGETPEAHVVHAEVAQSVL
jgi:hypothetical protein